MVMRHACGSVVPSRCATPRPRPRRRRPPSPVPVKTVSRAGIPRFGVVGLRRRKKKPKNRAEARNEKKHPNSTKTPPKSTKTPPKDEKKHPSKISRLHAKKTALFQKRMVLLVRPDDQQRREIPLWLWVGTVSKPHPTQTRARAGRALTHGRRPGGRWGRSKNCRTRRKRHRARAWSVGLLALG